MRRLANRHFLAVAGSSLALVAFERRETQAHKGDHVVLRLQQGHLSDLPRPLRDLPLRGRSRADVAHRYKDDTGSGARAWGQSIRDYLVTGQMPPWYRRSARARHEGRLRSSVERARQADHVGSGRHTRRRTKPATKVRRSLQARWGNGAPDLKVQMPAEHTLPPGMLDDTKEFVLSTGLKEARWLQGIDLLPGKPSMVRAATDLGRRRAGARRTGCPATTRSRRRTARRSSWPPARSCASRSSTRSRISTSRMRSRIAARSGSTSPLRGREIQTVTIDWTAQRARWQEREHHSRDARRGRPPVARPAVRVGEDRRGQRRQAHAAAVAEGRARRVAPPLLAGQPIARPRRKPSK